MAIEIAFEIMLQEQHTFRNFKQPCNYIAIASYVILETKSSLNDHCYTYLRMRSCNNFSQFKFNFEINYIIIKLAIRIKMHIYIIL